MFFSGALSEQQMDDMYKSGLGVTKCAVGRWLSVGAPASGLAIFTHVPFGFPHGLLQHDMVDRFLLYFFAQSAHANTRGTWNTPESASIDRGSGAISYSAAGYTTLFRSISEIGRVIRGQPQQGRAVLCNVVTARCFADLLPHRAHLDERTI